MFVFIRHYKLSELNTTVVLCVAALSSYAKSAAAWAEGVFSAELAPVTIPGKRGKPDTVVSEDEEYKKVNKDKFSKLATVFQVMTSIYRNSSVEL